MNIKAKICVAVLSLMVAGTMAEAVSLSTTIPLPPLVQINPVTQLLRLEQTMYEGNIWYYPVLKSYPAPQDATMQAFWWGRLGGFVTSDDNYFFPNLWANNADIDFLLANIGVATNATLSSANMWFQTCKIWQWMSSHAVNEGEVYSTGIAFPSIADMAWFYRRNGYIRQGACTTTAQLMATLMARAGIPVNRIALGHAHYGPAASHVYVILLMDEGWYYLDPFSCHAIHQLPSYSSRFSVGNNQNCDYSHPFGIDILPGSDLNSAPWCLDP